MLILGRHVIGLFEARIFGFYGKVRASQGWRGATLSTEAFPSRLTFSVMQEALRFVGLGRSNCGVLSNSPKLIKSLPPQPTTTGAVTIPLRYTHPPIRTSGVLIPRIPAAPPQICSTNPSPTTVQAQPSPKLKQPQPRRVPATTCRTDG